MNLEIVNKSLVRARLMVLLARSMLRNPVKGPSKNGTGCDLLDPLDRGELGRKLLQVGFQLPQRAIFSPDQVPD